MFRLALCLLALHSASAADLPLPKPQTTGGKPLMQVLSERKSSRDFAARPIAPQVLSNLLWAAYGVNRPASGGRTAPSAHNWQTVDLYVALEKGLYLYDAKANLLREVAATDARAIAGTQDFTATAPLNLVLVARLEKTKRAEGDTEIDVREWVAVEAGAISQNVSLYCASEGLATVVRAGVQRPALTKLAKLPADAVIVIAQTVGYPK